LSARRNGTAMGVHEEMALRWKVVAIAVACIEFDPGVLDDYTLRYQSVGTVVAVAVTSREIDPDLEVWPRSVGSMSMRQQSRSYG
jgi:hypothetical protein